MSKFATARAVTGLAALTMGWLATKRAEAAAPQLLVFLHTAVKQRALQDALSSGLPGVSVTTVGRVADFERKLAEGPDAVLTLPVVLKSKRLPMSLIGHRSGVSSEKYVLVAADSAPAPSQVGTVGALDILGRAGTNSFVADLLGASPKVVRVTKVEDLLPLLQMRRADGVVLPARLQAALASASRLKLAETELPSTVGLPAVAALGGTSSAVVTAIRSLPTNTSRLVGVDSWH